MLVLIHRLLTSSPFKFLVVGAINTIFGYLMFSMIFYVSNNTNLSVFLATILGVLFNFKTYSSLVFKNKNNKLILKFVLFYMFFMLFQMFLIKIITMQGCSNIYLISALIALPMATISYICMRQFVFR